MRWRVPAAAMRRVDVCAPCAGFFLCAGASTVTAGSGTLDCALALVTAAKTSTNNTAAPMTTPA
ncbi:MAG: hypothetical protein AB1586_13895 [Pseudomonadota bacterium]